MQQCADDFDDRATHSCLNKSATNGRSSFQSSTSQGREVCLVLKILKQIATALDKSFQIESKPQTHCPSGRPQSVTRWLLPRNILCFDQWVARTCLLRWHSSREQGGKCDRDRTLSMTDQAVTRDRERRAARGTLNYRR